MLTKTRTLITILFAAMMLPAAAHAGGSDHSGGFHIPADPRGPGLVPDCDHDRVLAKIANRQAYADRRTWKTGVTITGFENERERRYQPKTVYGTIGRRYCQAHALLSDGTHPQIYYLIEERQGFASIGWNVEFCMAGHDDWYVYGSRCQILRRH